MQSGLFQPRVLRATPRQRPALGGRPAPALLRTSLARQGLGSDVAGGFLDVSKLVSSGGTSQKTPYDDLATKLGAQRDCAHAHLFHIHACLRPCAEQARNPPCDAGQDLYADLQGWHLFLKDMKGSQGLKMSQVGCRHHIEILHNVV